MSSQVKKSLNTLRECFLVQRVALSAHQSTTSYLYRLIIQLQRTMLVHSWLSLSFFGFWFGFFWGGVGVFWLLLFCWLKFLITPVFAQTVIAYN